MILTIGSTSFEITSCTRKRDTQRGFYLELVIPKDNIGMDELYALLDGNEENIVVDENVYIGFKQVGSFALENGSYKVAQICTSEYEAQLSLAQNKIKEQDTTISTMQTTIDTQTAEILAQAEVIVLQGETIATQNEQVAALMEASTSQLDAIDSIMTEVLPLVAQEAASMAVEQALAAIAETETPEEIPEITLEEAEAEAALTEEN